MHPEMPGIKYFSSFGQFWIIQSPPTSWSNANDKPTSSWTNCQPAQRMFGFGASASCSAGWSGIWAGGFGSIHGNKNYELLYIVGDDDTLAVVEELLVIRSRSISTVVGGGVSGISDLKKKKEKLINQNYVIFNIQFPWMFELVPTPSQVPASIRLFTVASMSSSPPTD